MARIIFLIVIGVLIAGCGTKRAQTEYEFVDKPVLVCPTPQELNGGNPIPYRPHLEIYNLTDDSSAGEVSRAYEITIKELQEKRASSPVTKKIIQMVADLFTVIRKVKALAAEKKPEELKVLVKIDLETPGSPIPI